MSLFHLYDTHISSLGSKYFQSLVTPQVQTHCVCMTNTFYLNCLLFYISEKDIMRGDLMQLKNKSQVTLPGIR